MLISAHIHAQNTSVGTLACMEGNKVDPIVLRGAIKRLKWRQEIIAIYCRQLIDKIEALGIAEPVLRNAKKPKSEGAELWLNKVGAAHPGVTHLVAVGV